MRYNITAQDGFRESVTAFHEGREYVATATHPRFEEILEALEAGEDPDWVVTLFDLTEPVREAFTRVSERVLVANGEVLFDGEPVSDVISRPMLALLEERSSDFAPLVAFLEKLGQNPTQHSREQLFGWLRANAFSVTLDGDIVAYKGVRRSFDGGGYLSVNSGQAIVNGRRVSGHIPTNPGTIVEMPRSEVTHDPTIGCHVGLHAGDWSYASTFSNVTLRVVINPRDVVSVPTDCDQRKMRVCRYRVLGETTEADRGVFHVTGDELPLATLPGQDGPDFFEEYDEEDFEEMAQDEAVWLGDEWGVVTEDITPEELPRTLAQRARERWAKIMGKG